uniref:RNA-directed DNA polymerase, putative n=1 Tax=Medicago truncatula TaxID=3880 RepID=A2Q2S0_MEDTR|nr:RNA-directed DNA polymerase, putative [Medicago truncatula]
MICRSKKETFSFIKDQIWKKRNSWSNKCFSKAGREVLIKPVLQFIPSYFMCLFTFPWSLCDEIEKKNMNSFWWVIQDRIVKVLIGSLGINFQCTIKLEA